MKTAEELYKLVNKESDDWLEEMIREKMKDNEFFITLSEEFCILLIRKKE